MASTSIENWPDGVLLWLEKWDEKEKQSHLRSLREVESFKASAQFFVLTLLVIPKAISSVFVDYVVTSRAKEDDNCTSSDLLATTTQLSVGCLIVLLMLMLYYIYKYIQLQCCMANRRCCIDDKKECKHPQNCDEFITNRCRIGVKDYLFCCCWVHHDDLKTDHNALPVFGFFLSCVAGLVVALATVVTICDVVQFFYSRGRCESDLVDVMLVDMTASIVVFVLVGWILILACVRVWSRPHDYVEYQQVCKCDCSDADWEVCCFMLTFQVCCCYTYYPTTDMPEETRPINSDHADCARNSEQYQEIV